MTAQRLYDDEKKYITAVQLNEHAAGRCTDAKGFPLKDCAVQCPEEPAEFGRIDIGKEQFYFNTLGKRVVSLSDVDNAKKNYDIYWRGDVKDRTRDGPYQYNHKRKVWQKVQPWWPARKDK